MAAVDPSVLIEVATLPLAVDTGGSVAWGMTVADLRQAPQSVDDRFHPWRVALDADEAALRAAFGSLLD